MRNYDLTIQSPDPCAFIVTAFDDESAAKLMRECLQLDYADEDDPAVLASRVRLVIRANGHAVLDAQLDELLKQDVGGSALTVVL